MRAALIVVGAVATVFNLDPLQPAANKDFPGTIVAAAGIPPSMESAGISGRSEPRQEVVIEVFETITVSDEVPPPTVTDPTFTVNATDDVDDSTCDIVHCSLREAITASNAHPRPATIAFEIPDPGPHTIQPTSALPRITDPVVIDGYTQPGASHNTNPPESGTNAVLMIELDGTNAGDNASGLVIEAGGSTVRGLVINRFPGGGDGIQILFQGGNHIQGNFIGTDVSGTAALGNDIGVLISAGAQANVIGTGDGLDDVAERNIISGNDRAGVHIQRGGAGRETDQNIVAGNLIGTDATGTVAVGNQRGVVIINGPRFNRIGSDGDALGDAAERNVISGNRVDGIFISDPAGAGTGDNVVAGNYIGTDVTGTTALGNRRGVQVANGASNNTIGGTLPGAGNTIAFNNVRGVLVQSGTGTAILSNAIFSNGGLGIDLGGDGVTANDPGDADDGPNELQNFPVITGFAQHPGPPPGVDPGFITGTINSTPSTPFGIEFFANASCDDALHGEGETLLASIAVTTSANGLGDFEASIPVSLPLSAFLTATATNRSTGSTSEFSRCRAAGYTVLDAGDQTITDSRAVLQSGQLGFGLAVEGGKVAATIGFCNVGASIAAPFIPGGAVIRAAVAGLGQLNGGDQIRVGCGSAHIEVEVGPIEILLDDNTEAIVPANAIVTIEAVDEGQIQIQNDSPEGTEPVQIAVGGTVVGEIATGESLNQAVVELTKAELKLEEDEDDAEDGDDEFEIEGTLMVGELSDGFDVLGEQVSVTLGTFTFALVAGSFERDDDDDEFKFEGDVDGDGEVEIKIQGDGEFKIEVKEVDLSGLDLSAPVPFALGIGDDFASTAIPFDEDGEFQAAPAAVLAGAFDLRVGPESLTVAPREAATFTVNLGTRGVFAGKTVSLACAGLPGGASCSFAPRTLTPDARGASSVLTVTTDGSEGVLYRASRWTQLPLGLGLAALLLGGLVLGRSNGRRRRRTFLSLGLLLLAVGLYTACADEVLVPRGFQPTPRGTHAFKVIATAGAEERAVAVTLTVGDPEVPARGRAIGGTLDP